mmetsp:Transcript_26131/g.43187  ORF Transcript_26131/g.43187 Transcript_26131/m.43187 type:complete len:418 (+) Transcript_26131:91-1344(+)|eukprot:CAMPEP_0119323272 /NCGR_PEP_ID=MMETSP1333-20130426/60406_1 /TAXON_ID=418940 /ORGANISM="Scyphosphaera apsteinii, Strain RCC1455" /LENGTH=417 /DNA_ID=CAMNT_0007330673 /DNA_START=71 /DNA_END=1324 /DNA_ORIENTATION=+
MTKGRAENAEPKSKRPADTPFKQQNLKAWRPILTPKAVILTFTFVGVVFVPIGVAVYMASLNVIEVTSGDYDLECSQVNYSTTHSGRRVDHNPCWIWLNITEDMEPPIYMYYKLTNYYQNHRQYVKSRSVSQLAGKGSKKASELEVDCSYKFAAKSQKHADEEGIEYNSVANSVSPCGLIAFSLFNDSFQLYSVDDNGVQTEKYQKMTDISWPSDRSNKYKNADDGSTGLNFDGFKTERVLSCEQLPDGKTPSSKQKNDCLEWNAKEDLKFKPGWCYPGSGYCVEDEHFIVWMRTAGLPTFRKLYAIIDEKLKKGRYQVKIWNGQLFNTTQGTPVNPVTQMAQRSLYPVHNFHGEKMVVLSTTEWIGGRNDFLGLSYVGVGAICLVLAFAFFIKDRMSPREILGTRSPGTTWRKDAE